MFGTRRIEFAEPFAERDEFGVRELLPMEYDHEPLAPHAFDRVDIVLCNRTRQVDAADFRTEYRVRMLNRQRHAALRWIGGSVPDIRLRLTPIAPRFRNRPPCRNDGLRAHFAVAVLARSSPRAPVHGPTLSRPGGRRT